VTGLNHGRPSIHKARALAGDVITTTLSTVGKRFSETPRTPAQIEAYADALADMFCACLKGLEQN
jgi:hypothetical protein